MKKNFYVAFLMIALSISWGCDEKATTDLLDSMVATYSVSETWKENNVPMSRPTFTMNVVKSFQSTDKILLNNFGNYGVGTTVEATVKGNAVTFTKQTLPNSRSVEGTGTSSDTGMEFTYTETQGSISVIITATCKKL